MTTTVTTATAAAITGTGATLRDQDRGGSTGLGNRLPQRTGVTQPGFPRCPPSPPPLAPL